MKKIGRTNLFQTQINLIKSDKPKEINREKDKLFFDFLNIQEPIPEFEPKLEEPLLEVNNFKLENAFYNAFEKMKKESTWKKYKFPKIIFIKLYQNSKKLKKRIINYSILHLKRASEVIESYNPQYNIDKKKHNWEKNPKESYTSYYNFITRRNLILDKEKENNNLNYGLFPKEIGQKSNIVIFTRNKNQTNDLIYSGKLCNIYIQSEFSKNSKESFNNNKPGKKHYFFSFNESRNSVKKNDIENEKEKENKIYKYNSHDNLLFGKKNNSCKLDKKGSNYFYMDKINVNFSSKSRKKFINYKSASSRYKMSLINKIKKNTLYFHKNNLSTTQIPKLKEFLLNKSDFYY